jgi:hypothetical protein
VSDKISPVLQLFCVDIRRNPRDLGLSIVLPATCELVARREVLRLFPEYWHNLVLMQVSLARYVELDWDSGRHIVVVKREHAPAIPPCIAKTAKPKHKKLPPIEQEGIE